MSYKSFFHLYPKCYQKLFYNTLTIGFICLFLEFGTPLISFSSPAFTKNNIQISQSNAGAFEVSITSTLRGFGFAWYDTRTGIPQIFFTETNKNGDKIIPEIQISYSKAKSYEPSIAWNGKNFGIVWYDVISKTNYKIQFALLSEKGKILKQFNISTNQGKNRNPIILWNKKNFSIIWLEENPLSNHVNVMAIQTDKTGNPITKKTCIGKASKTTWNINGYYHKNGTLKITFDAKLNTKKSELYLITVSPTLKTAIQKRISLDDGYASKYPDISFSGSQYGITWFDNKYGNNEIFFSFYNKNMNMVNPMRITHNKGDSIGAYLSWNGAVYGICWCDDSTGNYEIYLALIDPQLKKILKSGAITSAQNASYIPAIASLNGCFGISWNDMRHNSTSNDFDHSEIFFQYICP